MKPLASAEFEALQAWPTPAISNAIETFSIRPRNQGFMLGIKCIFPDFSPMVGYACTATILADLPPTDKDSRSFHPHWDNILKMPGPRVAVILGSSSLREPAVELRGLANRGSPSSRRSRFMLSKVRNGM